MSNPKVLEILRKYADERAPTITPAAVQPQQQKVDDLSHQLQMKTKVVLGELEHDVSLLRMRGFDREMWKLLSGLWQSLEAISKKANPKNPYATAHEIVEFVNNRHTKAVIDNLIFLSEHHLKKTNVNFTPNKFMVQPEVRGLPLLKHLAEFAEGVAKEGSSTIQQTWRPPSMEMPAVKLPAPSDVPKEV